MNVLASRFVQSFSFASFFTICRSNAAITMASSTLANPEEIMTDLRDSPVLLVLAHAEYYLSRYPTLSMGARD